MEGEEMKNKGKVLCSEYIDKINGIKVHDLTWDSARECMILTDDILCTGFSFLIAGTIYLTSHTYREEEFILFHLLRVQSLMSEKAWWQMCKREQMILLPVWGKKKNTEWWCSTHSSVFNQLRTPVHRTMSPTFRVSLPSVLQRLWKCCLTLLCVLVISNSLRLTMKINHHASPEKCYINSENCKWLNSVEIYNIHL